MSKINKIKRRTLGSFLLSIIGLYLMFFALSYLIPSFLQAKTKQLELETDFIDLYEKYLTSEDLKFKDSIKCEAYFKISDPENIKFNISGMDDIEGFENWINNIKLENK